MPNNTNNSGWQYNSGGSKKNGRDDPNWFTIIVLFALGCGFPVFFIPAIIMLIKKLTNLTPQQRNQYAQQFRTTANGARSAAQEARDEFRRATADVRGEANYAKPNPGPAKQQKAAKAKKGPGTRRPGLALTIIGAVLSGSFAIALFDTSMDIFRGIFNGWFYSGMLTGAFVLALFLAAGLFLLFKGIGSGKEQERFFSYLGYIGANREVNLAHMAAAFDVPVKKLCKDLRKMLAKGILPTGYLDLAAGKLFLTEMGAKAPEPEAAQESEADATEREGNDILWEIRQVNDAIPDEVMTDKIRRIEEVTGKILAYQKTHPDHSSELRSFLNYYLPTTLKILRAYAQLDAQGVEGENISSAKARIEGMMDQVVNGFEKQLDKLFHNDAMDITSDVQVLENMLKKDGLSDDEGMTMTL